MLRLLLAAARAATPNSKRRCLARANFHFSHRLGWWTNPASGAGSDRLDAFETLAPHRLRFGLRPTSTADENKIHVDATARKEATVTVDAMGSSKSIKSEDHFPGEDGSPIVFFEEAPSTPAEAWADLSNYAFEVM